MPKSAQSLHYRSTSSGFTLIELLVVIFIIGVLAALLITNFAGIRNRASDSKSKADLIQLKKSLRLYYNDYQSYPNNSGSDIAGCGAAGATACSSDVFSNGSDIVYMKDLPDGMSYYSDGDEEFLAIIELSNASDGDITTSQTTCDPGSRLYYTDGPISDTEYVVCED